jgi:hypothetical protein
VASAGLNEELFKLDSDEKNLMAVRQAVDKKYKVIQEKRAKVKALVSVEEEELNRTKLVRRELQAIENLRSQITCSNSLVSEILLASEIEKDSRSQKVKDAQALVMMARAFILKKANYLRLGSLLFFFIIYSVTLFLQRAGTSTYEIESRQ